MQQIITILSPSDWKDYELIDAGSERKLERFGSFICIRPEPKALWDPAGHELWGRAHALYQRDNTGGGRWAFKTRLADSWQISWKDLNFIVKPTGFKHMGIFPEQAALWQFIINKIKSAHRPIKVLNLFAYTGGSTLAAAHAGASVTHLDASKDVLTWARENAVASGLDAKPIRWIPEDALTFIQREIKRGNRYDAIIMDPPKFGRGTKNEVWKIEEDLPKIIKLCRELLSPNPLFFILNAYAVSYSSVTLGNILFQVMSKYKGQIIHGELATPLSAQPLYLPQSIFTIWED